MLIVSDFVEWLGSLWGDQREFLTCNEHGGEIVWDDGAPEGCPVCGAGLYVHTPHSEELLLRWILWKQRWFPHRTYTLWREGGDLKMWRWRDRVLSTRPYNRDVLAIKEGT